ncbi:MAG TPA: hypothetical protein VFR41_05700 [Acidimicrobiia bacterium]|nr:hypothetical protein [Acidimicrobiia bacterium]
MARRPHHQMKLDVRLDAPDRKRAWGPARTVALLTAILFTGGAALTGAHSGGVPFADATVASNARLAAAHAASGARSLERDPLFRGTGSPGRRAPKRPVHRRVVKPKAAAVRAQTPAPQPVAPRVTYRPAPPGPWTGPLSQDPFLVCTRAHESNSAGGYRAISPGGTYRGAYQFVQSTWNGAAMGAGRPDLVNVDPATAAPADQDQLAMYLYRMRGAAPWGGRCAGLP